MKGSQWRTVRIANFPPFARLPDWIVEVLNLNALPRARLWANRAGNWPLDREAEDSSSNGSGDEDGSSNGSEDEGRSSNVSSDEEGGSGIRDDKEASNNNSNEEVETGDKPDNEEADNNGLQDDDIAGGHVGDWDLHEHEPSGPGDVTNFGQQKHPSADIPQSPPNLVTAVGNEVPVQISTHNDAFGINIMPGSTVERIMNWLEHSGSDGADSDGPAGVAVVGAEPGSGGNGEPTGGGGTAPEENPTRADNVNGGEKAQEGNVSADKDDELAPDHISLQRDDVPAATDGLGGGAAPGDNHPPGGDVDMVGDNGVEARGGREPRDNAPAGNGKHSDTLMTSHLPNNAY
jgi:hypothetical protein